MKTLIWNGSPRKDGDTASLIKHLLENLHSDLKIVDAYSCGIGPCIDCRYCWENHGCCIQDGMQDIYRYIEECDNILIASPIYYSELTGALLNVMSRLQTYFCAQYFRRIRPIKKYKKGAVILVGGGDGSMDKPYGTACGLLRHMHARDIHPLVFDHNTNNRPAVQNPAVLAGVSSIAHFFQER